VTIHECPYCPDGSCGTCRDARWMAVVRRLWRQRDTLSALVKQDCADLVQSQNAYEDEHRRATRLQERVTWLENNWTPPEEPCDD